MTLPSGIKVLILSIVLWGGAVWFLGAPHPAPTEASATTETAATPISAGTTAAGADGSAGAETAAAAASTTEASVTAAVSPGSGTAAGGASVRSGSADATAAVPAPGSAATGAGTRIAAAPANGDAAVAPPAPPSTPAASDTTDATAKPAAGSPLPPPAPEAGSVRDSVADSPIRPPLPPPAWLEHPLSRPPLPARPGSGTADGSVVAAQINAARRAAWEGRLADALAHYQAAARMRPDLHVVWGEMGNVLWTMRRWPEAAYALEGAATLLARAGELRAASELVPAMESIDPDAAYRVKQLLWAAVQRQSG